MSEFEKILLVLLFVIALELSSITSAIKKSKGDKRDLD